MITTKMSVRRRLLLLCFTTVILIVCFSAYLIVQITERLHTYTVMSEKVQVLSELTVLNKQLYQLLSLRLHGKSTEELLTKVRNRVNLLGSIVHSEQHSHYGIVSGSSFQKMPRLLEELNLLVERASKTNKNELFNVGNQLFDVLYELNADVAEHDSNMTSVHLHDSDLVLNNLRWLYYWMEREAWLAEEILAGNLQDLTYLRQYIRASELQKQYFDRYISSEARTDHLKQIAVLLSNPSFHKSELIRDKIIRNKVGPSDLSGYIELINARNQLIEKQTSDFHEHFRSELESHIQEYRLLILYISLALVLFLAFTFYLCLSTLYRINHKLNEILETFGKVRNGDYKERIR